MALDDSLLKDALAALLKAARDQNILMNMLAENIRTESALKEAARENSGDMDAFNKAVEKILVESAAALKTLSESGNDATRRMDSLLARIEECNK